MNPKRNRSLVCATLIVIVLALSACGTLRIESEPAAEPIEPTATAAEMAQPTERGEETRATPTEPVAVDVVAEATAAATVPPGDPSGELLTYTNSEYGFTLNYPSTWTADEVNGDEFVGPGSRSVQFSRDTVKLVIGYRGAGEGAAIGGSGAPAGEPEIRGSVHVVGQDVDRHVIVFEGKEKVVTYGQPETPISAGGLEFAPRLDDFAQVAFEDVELSQSVQDDADMILNSLALIEVEGATTGGADGDNDGGWVPYANESLGYSLMYPADADIMGANRDEAVEFVGPIKGADRWPWFSVQHFDSTFFRPPAGTDVGEWMANSDISYKDDAQEMTIGGMPAVHFRVDASQQAYGMDEYYVINGDRLYKITLLHAGGLEDWALYDRFLQSFTFGEPQG